MTTERMLNTPDLTSDEGGLTDDENPSFLIVVDRIQLTMCVVGAIVNIMTVVTLNKNGTGFQPCVSTLLLLQSALFLSGKFYLNCMYGQLKRRKCGDNGE